MTVLAEPPAPHPARVDSAGGCSLGARILVSHMLGDRENALGLLDQLVADSLSSVRTAMLLWCDMAIQAAQVLDLGPAWIPVDGDPLTRFDAPVVWASGLMSARSSGDQARVHDLIHSESGAAAWNDRVLALLDMAGSVLSLAMATVT